MKTILILLIIMIILLSLGLFWCFKAIHNLCSAINSILESLNSYDKILGLEK